MTCRTASRLMFQRVLVHRTDHAPLLVLVAGVACGADWMGEFQVRLTSGNTLFPDVVKPKLQEPLVSLQETSGRRTAFSSRPTMEQLLPGSCTRRRLRRGGTSTGRAA